MKSRLLGLVKYLLLSCAGAGLLFLTFRGQNLGQIYRDISHADYFWIGLSLFASLLAYISRAWRWNLLIEPLGYKPLLHHSFFSLMAGYLANLAIPRIGEVTRCASLSRAGKIPFSILLGTVVAERVIDVISLLLLSCLALALEFDKLGGFAYRHILIPAAGRLATVTQNFPLLWILLLSGTALLAAFFLIKRYSLGNTLLGEKAANFIRGLLHGFKSVLKMKNNKLFLLHTFFIWTMYFLTSYFCFFALPATSGLGPAAGLFALVVGGFGMSAPVQGGFGTFHLFVSRGLQLYQVSLTDGLVFATLVHTFQTIFAIFLGGLSFFFLIFSKKEATA